MSTKSLDLSNHLSITCIVLSVIIIVLICVALGLQLRNKETFQSRSTIPKDDICRPLLHLMKLTQDHCARPNKEKRA